MASSREGLDLAAATTRSMLGWGVVAGVFYLVFGVVLGLTRSGFDFSRDALSVLLLGDQGWLQGLNLILAGLMTVVAAAGLVRTPAAPRAVGALVGAYGLCLVVSALFPPDATPAFAEATGLPGGGEFGITGLLHLAFGGVGFLSVGIAALLAGRWLGAAVSRTSGIWSRVAGVIVLVGFIGGAALAQGPAGVILLWVAVVAAWTWIALTCVAAYRTVPHPVIARRTPAATA